MSGTGRESEGEGGGGGGGGARSPGKGGSRSNGNDGRSASGDSCGAPACAAARSRLRALEDALVCAICHAPAAAPVTLHRCGHLFCSYCIRRVLGARSRCPEPHCREPATTASLTPLRWLDAAWGHAQGGGGGNSSGGIFSCGESARAGAANAPIAIGAGPGPQGTTRNDAASAPSTGNPDPPAGQRGPFRPPYLVHLTTVNSSRELLKRQLVKAGLSDAGSMDELLARHREYVLRHNANLDAAAPRAEKAIAAEVRQWELAIAAERAKAERREKGASWWDKQKPAPAKRKRAAELCAETGSLGVSAHLNSEKSGGDGGHAPDNGTLVLPGDSFDELIRKTRARTQRRLPVSMLSVERDGAHGVCEVSAERVPSEKLNALPVPGHTAAVTPASVAIVLVDSDNDEDGPIPTPPHSPESGRKASIASDDDCVIVAESMSQPLSAGNDRPAERAPSTPVPRTESNLPHFPSDKDLLQREGASGFAFCDSRADKSAQSPRVMQGSDDRTANPTMGMDFVPSTPTVQNKLGDEFEGDFRRNETEGDGMLARTADKLSVGDDDERLPAESSTPASQGKMGEVFEGDHSQIEIEAEITTGTPQKKLCFDTPSQMLADAESEIVCANIRLSPRLVPELSNSVSHPSIHAGSVDNPLSPDEYGFVIGKNAVSPGNEPTSRKELTPEMRERIQRNRLRAIALQRRKNARVNKEKDGG